MKITREHIIEEMCKEYFPHFHKVIDRREEGSVGTTPEEQAEIYHKMMFLYDNVIEKYTRIKNET